ncbi:MAG: hypothetical protein ACRC8Y_07555 [Chroococcales cyanobacterium]
MADLSVPIWRSPRTQNTQGTAYPGNSQHPGIETIVNTVTGPRSCLNL